MRWRARRLPRWDQEDPVQDCGALDRAFYASVVSSPDAYELSCYSGPAMTLSTFPPLSTFGESLLANWLGESRHSTPSSSRFVPHSVSSNRPRCSFPPPIPLDRAPTQMHRKRLCGDPRAARDPPYRRNHQYLRQHLPGRNYRRLIRLLN